MFITYNGKLVQQGGKYVAYSTPAAILYDIFMATTPQIIYKSTNQGLNFINDGSKGDFTVDAWYLPSEDELNAIYTNLFLEGVGNLNSENFWSSTEVDSSLAMMQSFADGTKTPTLKTDSNAGIPVHTFNAPVGAYSLRDSGPIGGLIFHVDGSTYYETAPRVGWESNSWCPSINVACGANGSAIGTGKNNTDLITAEYEYSIAESYSTYYQINYITGFGNPTCMIKLLSGDIVYGTDTGWFINHTQGWASRYSTNAQNIDSIIQASNGNIFYSQSSNYSDVVVSYNGGWTWSSLWD